MQQSLRPTKFYRTCGRNRRTACFFGTFIALSLSYPAQAILSDEVILEGNSELEDFVWNHIKNNQQVELGCVYGDKYLRSQTECTISAKFLQKILTQPQLVKQLPLKGIYISGAIINGDLDLSNTRELPTLFLLRSDLQGELSLNNTHLDKLMVFSGSHLRAINADSLWSKENFIFRSSTIDSDVNLFAGRFEAQLSFSNARIGGKFVCSDCEINKGLFLNRAQITGELQLNLIKVQAIVLLSQSQIDSRVDLSGSQIDADLRVEAAEIKEDFNAPNSKISRNVLMAGTAFRKGLNFFSSQVGGIFNAQDVTVVGSLIAANSKFDEILLGHNVFSGPVDFQHAAVNGNFLTSPSGEVWGSHASEYKSSMTLVGVNVGGNLSISNGTFQDIYLWNGSIGGGLLLRGLFKDKIMAEGLRSKGISLAGEFRGAIELLLSHVEGGIFFQDGGEITEQDGVLVLHRGPILTQLSLRFASIQGALSLSSEHGRARWVSMPGLQSRLDLSDATISTLQSRTDSFPDQVELAGFTYKRLVGFCGLSEMQVQRVSLRCLRDLLRRSNLFNPNVYLRLANYLKDSGDLSTANDLLFASRNREIQQAKSGHDFGEAARLIILRATIGFGIGDYAFRIFLWVAGLTFLTSAVLWTTVERARNNGLVWCIGASLNRLLPVVELSKEFTDFFNDPKRRRLRGWQMAFFSSISAFGWILSLFAVAAVTGLTQR